MTAKKPVDDLTVEYMFVDELVSADRNAKGHDEELIDGSMTRYGYAEPVVLDERTGKIVAGHGRKDSILARQTAGSLPPKHVKVVDGRYQVPVVRGWRSANDAEALAAGVTFNQSTIAGGWDWTLLLPDLQELEQIDNGLDALGFDAQDVSDLRDMHGNLDTLEAQQRKVGEPDPRGFWPVIRLRVSSETKKAFDMALASYSSSEDEDERVQALLAHLVDPDE